MCDFVALTRCCKLVSFLCFIFAVLLANLIKPIICQIFEGSRELRHAPFRENFYRARSAFQRRRSYVPNLKSLARAVLKIMFYRMPKIVGVTCPKPRSFSEKNYLHERSAFPTSYQRSNSFEDMFDRMLKILGVT